MSGRRPRCAGLRVWCGRGGFHATGRTQARRTDERGGVSRLRPVAVDEFGTENHLADGRVRRTPVAVLRRVGGRLPGQPGRHRPVRGRGGAPRHARPAIGTDDRGWADRRPLATAGPGGAGRCRGGPPPAVRRGRSRGVAGRGRPARRCARPQCHADHVDRCDRCRRPWLTSTNGTASAGRRPTARAADLLHRP